MKNKVLPIFLLLLVIFAGCSKNDDQDNNTPEQGVLGDVGNEWKARFDGNQDIVGRIIENNNGYIEIVLTLGKSSDTIKGRITDNAVYEFAHSYGDITKPFTMIEFDAEVGEIYTHEFGGMWFERQVVEKEEYMINCLGKKLETIGVYEEIPSGLNIELFGFTIRTILWYWHPTYGLVCIEVWTEEGDYYEIEFVSIDI